MAEGGARRPRAREHRRCGVGWPNRGSSSAGRWGRRYTARVSVQTIAWLRCLPVPPGTEVSRRCADKGAAAGAGGDGELGPRAASRTGASTGRAGGAALEHGRCRHVRVIGGAGGLFGANADIPVTARDRRNDRKRNEVESAVPRKGRRPGNGLCSKRRPNHRAHAPYQAPKDGTAAAAGNQQQPQRIDRQRRERQGISGGGEAAAATWSQQRREQQHRKIMLAGC